MAIGPIRGFVLGAFYGTVHAAPGRPLHLFITILVGHQVKRPVTQHVKIIVPFLVGFRKIREEADGIIHAARIVPGALEESPGHGGLADPHIAQHQFRGILFAPQVAPHGTGIGTEQVSLDIGHLVHVVDVGIAVGRNTVGRDRNAVQLLAPGRGPAERGNLTGRQGAAVQVTGIGHKQLFGGGTVPAIVFGTTSPSQ